MHRACKENPWDGWIEYHMHVSTKWCESSCGNYEFDLVVVVVALERQGKLLLINLSIYELLLLDGTAPASYEGVPFPSHVALSKT